MDDYKATLAKWRNFRHEGLPGFNAKTHVGPLPTKFELHDLLVLRTKIHSLEQEISKLFLKLEMRILSFGTLDMSKFDESD